MTPRTKTGTDVEVVSRKEGLATVTVRCRSKTPLLMNPKTLELLRMLRTGVRPAIKRDADPKDIAAAKVMVDENGQIIIPGENYFACLVKAGRRVQFDSKSKISTATDTILPEFFSLISEKLVLIGVDGKPLTGTDWEVDERGGVNPGDGAAISIVRPKFRDWGFEVTFEYNETKIALSKMAELIRFAGNAVGLGDFRPGKRGNFGRFEIESWTVVSRRSAEVEFPIIDLTEQAA